MFTISVTKPFSLSQLYMFWSVYTLSLIHFGFLSFVVHLKITEDGSCHQHFKISKTSRIFIDTGKLFSAKLAISAVLIKFERACFFPEEKGLVTNHPKHV